MRSNLLTTNIQARMFSWMCARRLTGGARRESESASYSPTSRVCRVFDFFNLSFFRRDHPAFRKVEIKWSAISKWPSHTISFLFFDKWTLLPLYSFVLGSGRSISFPLCTQSRGKAAWHKWRQGAPGEASHEKSLETKTWSSCCLLKAWWYPTYGERGNSGHMHTSKCTMYIQCFCSFGQHLLASAQQYGGCHWCLTDWLPDTQTKEYSATQLV